MEFVSGILTGILCYCGLYSSLRSVTGSRIISFFRVFLFTIYYTSSYLYFYHFLPGRVVERLELKFSAPVPVYCRHYFRHYGHILYLFESRYIQVRNYIKKDYQELLILLF